MNCLIPTSTISWHVIHYMSTSNGDFTSCTYSPTRPSHSSIAQAVSHQLPTSAAQVQSRVKSCDICSVQSGTGASLLQALQFSLQILILLNVPYVCHLEGEELVQLANYWLSYQLVSVLSHSTNLKKKELLTQGGDCSAQMLSLIMHLFNMAMCCCDMLSTHQTNICLDHDHVQLTV